MNTKLLKQKILDLAIRGKLSQQLKSDGTAKDLLTQISDERRKTRDERKGTRPKKSGVFLSEAQSAKSKDLKQIIPLDKSEAPFEIPANWEWVRLGEVCLLNPNDKVEDDLDVSFVPMTNINAGFANSFKSDFRKWKEVKSGFTHFAEGDVAVAKITPCFENRKSVIFTGLKNGYGAGTTELHILRAFKPLLNKYVFWYVKSEYFIQNGIGNFSGAVGQQRVGKDIFYNAKFPLPPLAEQQRIVAKIEEAFAEIDSIENNKDLLKTHIKQARQKILDLAIHGKLVPQNKSDEPASVLLERITRDNPHYEKIEDEPFEIPENWAWCRLRNLSESIQYGYNAPAKDSGRIKMVRISDIHENEVEWDSVPYCDIDDKEIQTYLLKKNDILFARTGGTVGKSFIVSNLPEDAVYAGYLIRTRYGKNANAQYMKYFMESNLYWEQLRDGCIATAQPNCNGKTLGKMQIPLPPLAEQSRIVAKIEELFSTLDQMERNLV